MAQTDREIPEFVSVNPSVAIEVKNKLDKIDEINSKRMNGAKILREMLGRSLLDKCILELPYEASDRKHVYYRFPVKVYNKKKFFRIANFLKKYVYVLPPWKCPYGIEAKKLSEQLLLFDMKPSLLETHDLVNLVF
jgi:dTDP-4-amino-4,6-dideoxygalactose transaminase